jgi:hypothetical protein|tara:strand:+ start:358 stop:819 length:462 start_codon:yes stop_codon:yes gene_type:complete
MKKKVLFLHGLESKPGGTKPTFLQEHGFEILNPLLPKKDFLKSCDIAQGLVDSHQPDVIVGSSRGGAVAMAIDPKGAELILIAPAWVNFLGPSQVPARASILHSQLDDVVPFANSFDLSVKSGASLVDCGRGHRMDDPDALEKLLEVVTHVCK